MTKKQLLVNTVSFTIVPIAILSVTQHPASSSSAIINLQNTTAWWIIEAVILFVLWMNSHYFLEKGNYQNMKVVQWYLLWNILCFFRGIYIAETYWDWKGLVGNTFALLVPIVAYTATSKSTLQSILWFYIKFSLPLFAVIAFIISKDAYGFYLVPISFLMLFFPALSTRWKFVVVAFTLLVLTIDFDARSNVIKFIFPVLILLIYYFREIISIKLLEIIRKILIIIPILFFILAVSGVFNIFKMDNYIKGNYTNIKKDANGNETKSDIINDSRTFLYIEVLQSAKKYNTWWLGRSQARGNISETFGEFENLGRGERLANEVAILNIFTWTGIIGVILYLSVFYWASYMAINQSNNTFSKMIGVFIAFRWAFGWVEDVNYFTLNYFFLWIMIGICFSKSFRNMNNIEVIIWAKGIFDSRYKKEIINTKSKIDSIQ